MNLENVISLFITSNSCKFSENQNVTCTVEQFPLFYNRSEQII